MSGPDVPAEQADRYDPVAVAAVPDLSRPMLARARSTIGLLAALGLTLLVIAASAVGSADPASARAVRTVGGSAAFRADAITSSASQASDTGADVTTTEPGTATPLTSSGADGTGSSASEDRKVWAVVGGLVAVALALSLLTIRYWRQTRPMPVRSGRGPGRYARGHGDDGLDLDDGALLFGDLARGGTAISSEPEPSTPQPSTTASPSNRPAQLEVGPAEEVGAEPVAAEPSDVRSGVVESSVVESSLVEPAAETADPADPADHARADADWEPHATGELPRIDRVPSGPAARPTREARAAILRAARTD